MTTQSKASKPNRRASTTRQRRHQHLLDVKVRARKAVAQRTQRVLFSLCMFILVGSLLGGVAFGAKSILNALFFANPDYTLKTIEVSVDGNLSRESVLRAAAVSEGTNIFSINLPAVQQRLALLPQVEESHVQRVLPGKLLISIQERRPVAWVVPPDANSGSFNFENAYMVDRRGILLKTKGLAPEYMGLPAIIGVTVSNYLPGQPVDQDEVKEALALIRASSEILQARFQIQSIDVTKGYCLVVNDKQHASVTFGPDELEWQLKRLETILNYCDQNSKELQTVNLMAVRNVPVTFVGPPETEPAATATASPKPEASPEPSAKPLQTKTKSVPRRSRPAPRERRVRRAVLVDKTHLNGKR